MQLTALPVGQKFWSLFRQNPSRRASVFHLFFIQQKNARTVSHLVTSPARAPCPEVGRVGGTCNPWNLEWCANLLLKEGL